MSHGLESGLSGAALPLESGPGTPGLTQAQEGGGPGRHGPALSRDVLESVLRDRACSPQEKDVLPGLSGAPQQQPHTKGKSALPAGTLPAKGPQRPLAVPPSGLPRGSTSLQCTLRGEPHSPPMSRTHFVQHADLTVSPDSVLGQRVTSPYANGLKMENPDILLLILRYMVHSQRDRVR